MERKDLEHLWEEAWAALDRGEPQVALDLVSRVIKREPDLSEAHYIAGTAAMDLDDPKVARSHLQTACEKAPDWPDALSALAWANFRLCAFDDARRLVRRALVADDTLVGGHYLEGLLAERAGETDRSLAAFANARRLDATTYAKWPSLAAEEFERAVERALLLLPRSFRDVLDNLAVVVEPFPDVETLMEENPPHDPELLGLYVGVPLPEQTVASSGDLPAVIHLYQRNIERNAGTLEELEHEIAITLFHEIGHALGFEEAEMPDLGLE